MARNLDTASTDKITTTYTTHGTQRTYACWFNRNANDGRIFDKRTASAQVELIFNNGGPWEYDRNWSGSQGSWKVNDTIGTGVWGHIVVTYDAGATTNDPVIYLNAASQAFTLDSNPSSGTPNTNTDPYVIGNRGSDNARNFNGNLAEFAIWDRILTQEEITALATGYAPSFFPNSLVMYEPMIRDNVNLKVAPSTISGTAVVDHPRILYPGLAYLGLASGATAALTGTITASTTEADIVAGGKTIILTLTGDTWIAAGALSFDLQRQNIIDGLTSAQSELLGWNNVVKALQGTAGVVRTSDTVVTITLDAFATYNITATETITATIPATALTGAVAIVASPTFTVTAAASTVRLLASTGVGS